MNDPSTDAAEETARPLGGAVDGTIIADSSGNVMIGAPTAVAIVEILTDEDPED